MSECPPLHRWRAPGPMVEVMAHFCKRKTFIVPSAAAKGPPVSPVPRAGGPAPAVRSLESTSWWEAGSSVSEAARRPLSPGCWHLGAHPGSASGHLQTRVASHLSHISSALRRLFENSPHSESPQGPWGMEVPPDRGCQPDLGPQQGMRGDSGPAWSLRKLRDSHRTSRVQWPWKGTELGWAVTLGARCLLRAPDQGRNEESAHHHIHDRCKARVTDASTAAPATKPALAAARH